MVLHRPDAGALIPEITEDCIVGRGMEKSHHILSDIQEAGVEVTLDDFGTGYASLTHLRDLSVSEIKVDRSFTESLLSSKSNDAIVQSLIELAGCLGLRVIAEGVESREQMTALQNLGCKFAQGYYFARPVSFPKACELLKTGSIRNNIEQERKNFELIRAANF